MGKNKKGFDAFLEGLFKSELKEKDQKTKDISEDENTEPKKEEIKPKIGDQDLIRMLM